MNLTPSRIALSIIAFIMLISCSTDEVITVDSPPDFSFDNETGVFSVKIGQTITISPTYANVTGATFSWTEDGRILSLERELAISWNEVGSHYITLTVKNDVGIKSDEIRIDVNELLAPSISLPFTGEEVYLKTMSTYILTPEVSNIEVEGFSMEWTVNGVKFANGPVFNFIAEETGTYSVTVRAENIDGFDIKGFSIKVLDDLPYILEFPPISYMNHSTDRYTLPGRGVFLKPIMKNLEASSFKWSVDGKTIAGEESHLLFTPTEPGIYVVGLTVNESISISTRVFCENTDEKNILHKPNASCSRYSNKVFEYIPAPGQFIGETQTGGMSGNETTHELATEWAETRLSRKQYVSLGSFGGYIIVGFDHSIENIENGYDFAIQGNAFFNASNGVGGSNEPGIIYVMQDVNGNGLPDDEWYELKGSATGLSTTWSDYSVTYYRPSAPRMNVQWTDNHGQSGTVDYLASFHRQDYYYPAWILADSYTLYGTRLEARTTQDSTTGFWDNWAYDWGYADNMGNDNIAGADAITGDGQRNGFHISNAIYPDGTPIKLSHIDFIKVQTGVLSKSGWLGEVSTEVFGFEDLHIP